MKVFFDNCLSPKLAQAIRILVEPHQQVVHLRERFAASTADVIWLEQLGAEGGWVILSGDIRIARKNSAERAVWKQARLPAFFMESGFTKRKAIDQAAILMRMWTKLVAAAASATGSTGILVPIRGKKLRPWD